MATVAACLLIVAWGGARATVRAQAETRAEANQLHAAIVNGDVESLKYWLTVRHTDPTAANATNPDITPLVRCLTLAARVLDAPPGGERGAGETGAGPIVGLRVLQEMALLLHERGARLTDADRRRFSAPVLRWYDDAVSPPVSPREAKPAASPSEPSRPPSAPAAPSNEDPKPPAVSTPPSNPAVTFETTPVVITTDSRVPCNGSGHTVYLENHTQLSVTARVTTSEGAEAATNSSQKIHSYTVDPGNSWRLGCDASKDGRRVRYVLKSWR
jgi:hypothetical protein